MLLKDRKLRMQVVLFIIIIGSAITRLADAVAQFNDFNHFRLIHLALVLASGMLLGAIISRVKFIYFPEAR